MNVSQLTVNRGVISTNPARCRDCYRCVGTCPVKAVRVRGGQAEIIPELCIQCASCVRECPQRAKVVRDDRPAIRAALAAGRTVVATVAPSAPAYFDMLTFDQMELALRGLGFAAAGETAFGAEMVGLAHGELAGREPQRWPIIASSCPVIVNLVEHYYPDLIGHLAPIVSPMIAHGHYLRHKYGPQVYLVFVGPCVAKKGEIEAPAVAGVIDAAITFTELEEWLAERGLVFPGPAPLPAVETDRSCARLFPVEGGLVGTARLETDVLSSHTLVASGISACQSVLQGIRSGAMEACLVELMACEGGCINGPALMDQENVVLARQRVMAYARRRQPQPLPARDEWPPLGREYHDYSVAVPHFTEEQIQAVLQTVEKYSSQDELNCGACGYNSCRDKAVAVLRGMAEATMCIPYMRSRAESLTNVVMDVAPLAILIVDRNLRVQDISPSAEAMLHCHRQAVRGEPLRDILPVLDQFVQVSNTGQPSLNRVVHLGDNLVAEQSIVPVKGENLIVAILRDVTERELRREEMDRLRRETLQRTQEVINQQMRVAHEIASLLGETTADTKLLLSQLARIMIETGDEPDR